MTHTIPLLRPLDSTGLPHQPNPAPAAEPEAAPAADLTRYHHPLFVRSEPRVFGAALYFQGFTGREERPEMPMAAWEDKAVTWEQRRELSLQYDAARVMWSQARLRLQAGPVLRRAAPLWEAWTTAQAELHQVFAAFWTTPDGMWRAQLLKLTDAEQAAQSAARAWDQVAEELAKLAAEQLRAAGEEYDLPLTEVAKELGLDAADWVIDSPDQYETGPYSWRTETPVVRHATGEITQQRERLTEVARLAGDPDTAPPRT
ncbi:hypothetical protein ACFWG0_27600 [Streptomyces yangpuensis]|uniref:hypothetical protein n=1 Tax=Streptomyces yangpuensis TaxID=1648182 RepID=UPI0036578578